MAAHFLPYIQAGWETLVSLQPASSLFLLLLPSHPPSCLGIRLHTAAEPPSCAAVSTGKSPFIWPAVTVNVLPVLDGAAKSVLTPPYSPLVSLFPCNVCLSHCSTLARLRCSPSFPLPPPPHAQTLINSPHSRPFFSLLNAYEIAELSILFHRHLGKKRNKKKREMSWAGGLLVHHITGSLPIKEESLCYWRAA